MAHVNGISMHAIGNPFLRVLLALSNRTSAAHQVPGDEGERPAYKLAFYDRSIQKSKQPVKANSTRVRL